ncbi:efflux RND transporter periplasmic adaptor subunit [Paludisphaera mucosa]|uniref:HlyD family efflux transporter periplasmic adaptor subunit n=1 Tax=Paludisphaera mucosa TaxID=3030827 RepID=A0ABT6FDP5_9BACT|nr:HlyD family efflux transporter periplasmic adaptor subunit [Paludisphaera mucosa]MDG3005708.1 HlyD family efflux transporter periplasmic adaptor subunit [Paludisphaera mucosa]
MNPRFRPLAVACALAALETIARAQSLPTSATIDAEPLTLTAPERFQVVSTLEPIRRISIVAPADGTVRSVDATMGSPVTANQQVAELDRGEAAARLKIAEAELREKQAQIAIQQGPAAVAKAQVEAAEARVELARLELDRLTLRAPFGGRILATPVSSGQFVLKGTVIAELADVTTLKALAPVDRRAAKAGGEVAIFIEEQAQSAKIQSMGPLPTSEDYGPLRELAAPFAAAWIQVPNVKGELEPGLRVRSASLPSSPVVVVPRAAIKPPAAGSPDATVQVIRAEHVVDVRIKTLGAVGPERVQVSGAFRGSDALIVASSVSLLPGTFVRFGAEGKVEGAPPDRNQPGQAASVAPAPAAEPATRPAAKATRRPTAPPPANSAGATPF